MGRTGNIRLSALVATSLALWGSLAVAPASAAEVPFAEAILAATHNSYSGNMAGEKLSITYQLDHGIRFLEYDVLDEVYAATGDYTIGHGSTGYQVDHNGGNPQSNALRPWLQTINTWSLAYRGHGPIVLALDLKNDLTDNKSYAEGNLAALNDEIESVFGPRLWWADNITPDIMPAAEDLRGRVIVVLSGDARTRLLYRRDHGRDPAVAMNNNGMLVEVHKSPDNNTLWYWTGRYEEDGYVTWLRHGQYDTGQTPAVALNDNGDIVEVHQSQNTNGLWYHVGKLGADGEITWGPSRQYDNGRTPTVAFTSLSGTTLKEIHRNSANNQNYTWNGALDAPAKTVTWSGVAKTSAALYPKSTVNRSGKRLTVSTAANPADMLQYTTDAVVVPERIRYLQLAYTEYQEGDDLAKYGELKADSLFYAGPATSHTFIRDARKDGRYVRGWDFDPPATPSTPIANYLATNYPWRPEYWTLLRQNKLIDY